MKSVLKNLGLLILLAGLGVGGYGIGQSLRGDVKLPDIQVGDFLPPAPVPAAPDARKGMYAVSPVVAPLAKTLWVTEIMENGDELSVSVPSDQATRLAKGREVVFYNRRSQEAIAGVAYINRVEPGDGVVHAYFNKPDNLLLPVKRVSARIITMETVGTKQLPLSARFLDDEGHPYVWKLETINSDEGEYAALPLRVINGLSGDDYFEVGPEVAMNAKILAHPPADIESGAIIRLEEDATRTMANVTPLTEQARDIQRRENTRILKAQQQEYEEALGPAGSCGAQTTAQGIPAALSILTGGLPGAGNNGASTGCSSCSAPAAQTVPTGTDSAPAPAAPAEAAPASGGCNSCGTTY